MFNSYLLKISTNVPVLYIDMVPLVGFLSASNEGLKHGWLRASQTWYSFSLKYSLIIYMEETGDERFSCITN